MLEHLVFKGAGLRDNRTIAAQMDALGGDVNAFTTRDYTCFYAKVLDEKAHDAYQLLADLVSQPWLRGSDLAREKSVVEEEMRESLDDPDDVLDTLLTESLYEGDEYVHDILGSHDSLTAMSELLVQEFHRQYYQPANVVFAVSGGACQDLLEEVAGFRGADAGDGQGPRLRRPPQTRLKTQLANHQWEQVRLGLAGLAPRRYESEYGDALVAASLLGGQNTSRLWQRLREDEGLVYSVSTQYSAETDTGDVVTYLGTESTRLHRALRALYEEMEHLAAHGPSSDELARTVMYLQTLFVMNQETPDARVMRLGRYALDDRCAPQVRGFNESLANTTIAGVQKQVADWIRPQNVALAIAGPVPAGFELP